MKACPFCESTNLRDVAWADDTGEYDAIECSDCLGAAPSNIWNKRVGMAESLPTPQADLFNLLSHREALLLAESELAGSYGSVDQWKASLSDAEREVLESYDLEVQQAFDNITFIATGGLSGAERPCNSATALAMISHLPRIEPDHVPDQQEEP